MTTSVTGWKGEGSRSGLKVESSPFNFELSTSFNLELSTVDGILNLFPHALAGCLAATLDRS